MLFLGSSCRQCLPDVQTVSTSGILEYMATQLEQKLIAAGRDLLEARGIGAVTIREVARRCGVSHGAPRRHFPSLEELLAAIAEQYFHELRESMSEAGDRIVDTAKAYVEFAVQHPNAFELITRHDLLDGSGRELRSTSLSLLTDWQEQCQRQHPDSTPVHALSLWASIHGVAVLTSRRALDLVGADPYELVDEITRRSGVF
ncbi:TetR/AcrR family transcriptional regulator [Corynebacterium doosanense]|uniref:TetR/AcrR family transcriptional regulator n=1 Tax=Corynebacterium doosanense TaxID=1121358 RepID=UPI00316AE427